MLLALQLLRPLMFLQCRGIENQHHWMRQCAKYLPDNDDHDYGEDQVVQLYHFLQLNNLWVHQCVKNNINDQVEWKRFTIIVIQKVRQLACYNINLYHRILLHFPIRLCKYCLLFTSPTQSLCSFHIALVITLKRKLPKDLYLYIMQFCGLCHQGSHNYNHTLVPNKSDHSAA